MSRRATAVLAAVTGLSRGPRDPRPFRPGLPALDAFPFEVWARLEARRWRLAPRHLLDYGDPAGHAPLRHAIAAYLGEARGVRCEWDRVIIVAGSQQGLDLAARVLLDPGDAAWIEAPGYPGARGALEAAGLRLVPVPVDADGLDVEAGARLAPRARLAYVTPSHQYPLGVTMSLARRLALLEWARQARAWIIEDDYDSEYRYVGRPLSALQGLDTAGRVVYVGTLSKVLFPSLRLGYLVVPPSLVDVFAGARAIADRHAPLIAQAVLSDFIEDGHFARHIRRTRMLYAERQAALLDVARRELAGRLDVPAAGAGMHLGGWLPPGIRDRAAAQAAARHGVMAPPLSTYRMRPGGRGGLMLGYAAFTPREIRDAGRRLAQALGEMAGRPAGQGAE